MRNELFRETVRSMLAPVAAFLDDTAVTEILINGPRQVFIERAGRLQATDAHFTDEEQLMAVVRHVAQFIGHRIDGEHPILEARLPDGSRVEAVIPPASPSGAILAIRRFSRHRLSMQALVEGGSLSEAAALYLRRAMARRRNILVAGGTGSGKTSLLNALSDYADANERIVVIEDARELQLCGAHVVSLEARPPDVRGRGAVSVRDLFKATLRLRPDRIVVGEIRGAEALDLVQAMTSGHGGCLSTIHASRPAQALTRLETLALMSDVELPLRAVRSQIHAAVDLIVQSARFRDGSRGISHITEVVVDEGDERCHLRDRFLRQGSELVALASEKGVPS